MFVLTVDQRGSRLERADRVDDLLTRLNDPALARGRVRVFQRTAGDEVQGLLDDPELALRLVLLLVRDGHWSVGVGTGEVRRPLPRSVRAGAGAAFEHARTAVSRAKTAQERVALVGPDPVATRDAQAMLVLLAAIVQRRSHASWEAVDLVTTGLSQSAAADRLGISKQALSQRLHTGLWPHESGVHPVAASLLGAADPAEVSP